MTYRVSFPINHTGGPRFKIFLNVLKYVSDRVPPGKFENYEVHILEILNLEFDEHTHIFTFENEDEYLWFKLRWL